MTIKLPQPPPDGERILRERGRLRAGTSSTGDGVFATRPHRVYAVGRDALLGDQLLEAAQPTAWRYLLVNGEAALSAAELLQSDDGSLTFAETNSGPFVQSTADVLAAAERLDDVEREDFELRLLRVPSVYLVALWLYSDTSSLVLPLSPAPGGLEVGHPYSPDEVLAALKPLAQTQADFDAGA
jgi:hypothetical protein